MIHHGKRHSMGFGSKRKAVFVHKTSRSPLIMGRNGSLFVLLAVVFLVTRGVVARGTEATHRDSQADERRERNGRYYYDYLDEDENDPYFDDNDFDEDENDWEMEEEDEEGFYYDDDDDFYYDDDHLNYEDYEYYEDEIEYEWTEEQVKEMEKLYERYSQVFDEKFGIDAAGELEKDSKELVYTRFLEFKERKEQLSREELQRGSSTLPEENDGNETKTENESEGDMNDDLYTERNEDEIVFTGSSASAPDNLIVEVDPYFLESEWAEFNEVGGARTKNNTRIRLVPSTVVGVASGHTQVGRK
jgi:hypothetical protein